MGDGEGAEMKRTPYLNSAMAGHAPENLIALLLIQIVRNAKDV